MESVLRGAAIYFVMLIIVRLSGRRTLAQATTFDFVLLLIVAETTQQALLGNDFSITNAVLLICTLFLIDIGLALTSKKLPWLSKFIEGRPTFLIRDGVVDEHALRRARLGISEIMVAARAQHGLERLGQIRHAVLETDAGVTIVPRSGE